MKLKTSFFATSLIVLSSASALHAADASWTSTATTGNWNDATWTGGTPASGPTSTATFGTDITAATTITQNAPALQIGSITFSDNGASGSAWTLSGTNAITLGDGIAVGSSTITTTTAATISSILGGANSLTKAGAAVLTLSGANTYSGGTILNGGGALAIGNTTALGTGAVAVNSNSTLSYTTAFANNVVLNSANLSVSGNFNNLSGVISGTGNLTATGTVQMTGVNTFNGKTSITGGFFCFKADSAFGAVPTAFTADSITVSGGAAFSTYITGTAFTLHANRGIVLSAGNTGVWDINGALTINGVISGAGQLLKGNSNAGNMILTNANTYSGGTTISNGTLSLGTGGTGADTSSVNALSTGTVAINGTGTLRLWIQNSNSFTIPNNFTMNGGRLLGEDGIYTLPGTISLGASGGTIAANWGGKTVTSTGVISGTGPLNISQGPSTATGGGVIFSGANTYTGATSILGATLSVGSLNSVAGGTINSNLGTPVTVANGTLSMGSTTNTGGLTYTGTGETTDRVINLNGGSGGATLTQSGTGLLKFSSNLTATGLGSKTLTLSGSTAGTGELAGVISNNATTGSTALAATFALGATTVTLGSVDGVSVGATISGTGLAAGTTITLINNATKVVTLSTPATAASATAGTTYTVTGVTNPTALSKSGTGTWKLSGANTYTNGTTVSAGTLIASAAGTLGSTTGTVRMTGGILDLGSASHTVGTVTMAGGTIQTGTLTGSSYIASSGTNAVTAILAGSSSLSVSGGTLTLSGANTYNGGTTLSGGTITVSNASALGTAGLTVTANGNLANTVNFATNIVINPTVTLGLTGGNFSRINGVISGSGNITSSAASILNNANTYAGNTTITGGFFCIGADTSLGAAPSSFTANSITFTGGYISMYGSAANAITLSANRGITISSGTAAFDASAGQTLTVNGIITGAGNLNHNSANSTNGGTLVLAGLNTYTGSTSVTKGTLSISSIKNVGDTTGSSLGNVSTAPAGTIGIGGGTNTTTLAYTGTGSTTDRIINLASTTGGNTLTQSGTGLLSLTGGVTATGLGSKTLTLSGSTAGTGEISGPIVDNATVGTTGLAATFVLGATSVTLNSVAGIAVDAAISGTGIAPGTTITSFNSNSRIVTLSTPTIAASGAVNSIYTVDGVKNITSILKSGTGTWSLSGTNTYTGATTVSGGTLAITGTGVSTITVNSAGKLAPGTGIDSFTAPIVTLYGGSTYSAQIDSTSDTSDKFTVTSYVELFDATLSLKEIGTGTIPLGTKLTLIDYTGGALYGTFTGLADGATVNAGANSFTLTYDDSSKVTLTVIPGGYSTWADANANGDAANLDTDHDGVPNGVEYFMGQTGSSFTANPGIVGSTITWPKDPSANATYVIQTSTTLNEEVVPGDGGWSTATSGVVDNGTSVVYTIPTADPKRFTRIKVTTP